MSHKCLTQLPYSDEGHYLEDHDYLLCPYRRTGLCSRNNYENTLLTMCFICNNAYNSLLFEDHMLKIHRQHGNKFRCCFREFDLLTFNEHLFQHSCYCTVCRTSVVFPLHEASYQTLVEMKLITNFDNNGEISCDNNIPTVPESSDDITDERLTTNLYICEDCLSTFDSQTEWDSHNSNCEFAVDIIEEPILQESEENHEFYLEFAEEEEMEEEEDIYAMDLEDWYIYFIDSFVQ